MPFLIYVVVGVGRVCTVHTPYKYLNLAVSTSDIGPGRATFSHGFRNP